MADALTITDDVVLARAEALARRLGRPLDQVVEKALTLLEQSLEKEPDFPPEEVERRYLALRALSQETARHMIAGATSDDSDMYDEYGLPK